MLMSVCMPIAPRCRTSTPTAYLSKSLTVSAGVDAIVRLSMSVTIRALLCNATGIRVAVTFTLSILSGPGKSFNIFKILNIKSPLKS